MKTISMIVLSTIFFISCGQTAANKNAGKKAVQVQETSPVPPVVSTDTIINFNDDKKGVIPANWSEYATGKDNSTKWEISTDKGNQVLTQISNDHPNYHFNVIVFDGLVAKNVELQVKLKGLTGDMDQGGGFIWRFIDADNYYVVRANPLEDNVVLYKVKNGKRTDLALLGKGRTYGVDVEPLGGGWNTLKLNVQDDLFTVFLNGKEIFKVQDDTFTNAGKVGFWTKADAVTSFDDFKIIVK
jgi:hypothetical protein